LSGIEMINRTVPYISLVVFFVLCVIIISNNHAGFRFKFYCVKMITKGHQSFREEEGYAF